MEGEGGMEGGQRPQATVPGLAGSQRAQALQVGGPPTRHPHHSRGTHSREAVTFEGQGQGGGPAKWKRWWGGARKVWVWGSLLTR